MSTKNEQWTERFNECKELLNHYGGYLKLDSRLVCKMSPHSNPVILYELSIEDLEKYDLPTLQTIYQRLKGKYEREKESKNLYD